MATKNIKTKGDLDRRLWWQPANLRLDVIKKVVTRSTSLRKSVQIFLSPSATCIRIIGPALTQLGDGSRNGRVQNSRRWYSNTLSILIPWKRRLKGSRWYHLESGGDTEQLEGLHQGGGLPPAATWKGVSYIGETLTPQHELFMRKATTLKRKLVHAKAKLGSLKGVKN